MNTLMEKFIAIVLFVAFNAVAAEWTGSISEPESTRMIDGKSFYVINTADELAWFANKVNKGNLTINAILESDIVFGVNENTTSTVNWTPVGKDSTKMYEGVFDGAGHSIFGILSGDAKYVGVFGIVGQNGVVKNVCIKNGQINGTNRDVATYYAGGIAAINNGTIQNVINENKVTISKNSLSFVYAGGISSINNGSIIDCQNKDEITAKILTTVSTYPVAYSGGISGYNSGVISGCKNTAKIRAYSKTSNVMKKSDAFAGGIAGYNINNVNNSSNSGDVFAHGCKDNAGEFTSRSAGIVGYNTSTVLNCYNQGNTAVCLLSQSSSTDESGCGINYSQKYPSCVGGIVAYGKAKNSFDIVTNSYWLNKEEFQSSAENMQKDQFAWTLNTTNGTTTNSGVWSRTTDYPDFANESALPICKVVFNDNGATSNRYTNYQGLVSFPNDPIPDESHVFMGWYNAEDFRVKPTTVFSTDQTVNAVYVDASEVYWTIRFLNSDVEQTLLESKQYQHNSIVTYGGETPTRETTAQYTYTFKGWDVEPTNAVENFDYHAVYDSTIRSYTITFNDYDGTEIENASFEYGKMPSCNQIPTRAATAEWVYTHKGWKPALDYVTEATSYTATYDSTKVKYKVTFMNGTTVIDEQMILYGEGAVAPTNVTREGYRFIGWSATFSNVINNLTVKALFEEIVYRTIVIITEEGTSTSKVEENSEYNLPAGPQKVGYTFDGWYDVEGNLIGNSGDKITVTDNLTLEAKYTVIYYTITFVDADGTEISSAQVAYGTTPKAPNDPTKPSTAQYTYTFTGWDKNITKVTGTATYTATYNKSIRKYIVTFLDYDGSILDEQSVAYGNSAEKPIDPNRSGYKFVGWDVDYSTIVKKTDVTALYEKLSSSSSAFSSSESSIKSSGSFANSSSGSSIKSSDSSSKSSNSSDKNTDAFISSNIPAFYVSVVGHNILIANAKIGSAYAIFDMQGRVLKKGRVESANFNISITMAGNYLVRVDNRTQRITIK